MSLNTKAPKYEQARIIGQIQSIYSNASSLLKPTINQVDFEKAIKEDETRFYFDDIIKGYTSKTLEEINKETDEVKKSEILFQSMEQLSSLQPIDVVFDKVTKSIYVDVIDRESNSYKDNAINRKLNRVGDVIDNALLKSVNNDLIKGGVGSGRHPSSGEVLKEGDMLTHKKTGKQHTIESIDEKGSVSTNHESKISHFDVYNDYRHRPSLKKEKGGVDIGSDRNHPQHNP